MEIPNLTSSILGKDCNTNSAFTNGNAFDDLYRILLGFDFATFIPLAFIIHPRATQTLGQLQASPQATSG